MCTHHVHAALLRVAGSRPHRTSNTHLRAQTHQRMITVLKRALATQFGIRSGDMRGKDALIQELLTKVIGLRLKRRSNR